MKKQFSIMMATLLVIFLIGGCKKSNQDASKNYSSAIVNKNWWGTFSYKDQTEEYYSIHFNADSSFDWDQLLGSFKGHWSLTANKLTLTFVGNDTKITAVVGDDNKLSQISDNTDFSEINSGQLIENPNIPLENTTWSGLINYPSGSTQIIASFNPGDQGVIQFDNTQYPPQPYFRSSSGGVVRATDGIGNIFCVIISATEMKGSFNTFDYKVKMSKE